ncbi:MAG: signal peptide peptidase SppA [Chloroflexi bacterium]|nr:signal peptide peptidase SppA [Chloroflexota bacterium]MCI0580035.1 signal peptide peptidase SppA [Chloroflexota bacterium]MCI0646770.1 signal peptide peptidase SppA [Chloroflexota bacterium]MCI0730202.1 signal peptide peptidase SppA [Chloroflexota bacterium]
MEEKTPPIVARPAPPARGTESNRTVLWALISVVIGFMLPVIGCSMLIFVSMLSLAVAGAAAGGGNRPVSSGGLGDAVAIVRVEGVISASDDDDYTVGATSGVVIADLRAAAADPSVKAIVLRVDSPGGTVTGSAQIYEVVKELGKPVVVSMASTAASGGYYVSAPADYIFARPDSVTGSIGVIFTIINAEELMNELGVEVVTITSGPNKDMGSLWEELEPEHREIFEGLVAESYSEFVRVVAEGRNMSEEEVRRLADGRIYSGRQALAIGLVDELGDLQAAIDKAAELGGISGEPRIVEYEHPATLSQLLGGVNSRLNSSDSDQVLQAIEEFAAPRLEYRYLGPQ